MTRGGEGSTAIPRITDRIMLLEEVWSHIWMVEILFCRVVPIVTSACLLMYAEDKVGR